MKGMLHFSSKLRKIACVFALRERGHVRIDFHRPQELAAFKAKSLEEVTRVIGSTIAG
jgi:hypothetical protein